MLVYHGTTDANGLLIERNGIDLLHSKTFLDFSKGFYTTPDYSFAYKTANRRFDTSRFFINLRNTIHGIAIVVLDYNEEYASSNLKVKRFDCPSNKWAKFIVANRISDSSEFDFSKVDNNRDLRYDIVVGPTADGGKKIEDLILSIEEDVTKFNNVNAHLCLPSSSASWGSQISFHTKEATSCNVLKLKTVLYERKE